MFSGIVEETGKIKGLQYKDRALSLVIEAKTVLSGTKKGDSVSVNGVCLTVTEIKRGAFTAQAVEETLQKTNLGSLKVADRVNLERALKVSDRISGHFVSGHIDMACSVKNIVKNHSSWEIFVSAPEELLRFLVEKGSVALNGVSLTVAKIKASSFSVVIIPHTLKNTNLYLIKAGDKINVEADMIGKYIAKYLDKSVSSAPFSGKNIISNFIDMAEGGDLACN